MITPGDFQGLVSAFQLKSTLQQVDSRNMPGGSRHMRTAAEMSGLQRLTAMQQVSTTLPVLTQDGRAFAHNFISKSDYALAASSSVREGDIVEFDTGKQGSAYGLVIPPPSLAVAKGVYIKHLTKDQAANLKLENPDLRSVVLKQENLKPIKEDAWNDIDTPKVLSLPDSFERTMFQTLRESLRYVKNNKDEIIDVLLWVYLFLVVAAVVWLTLVFSKLR